MTGRIRSIKPETHLDEDLWDADVECPELHLFRSFTGLWCQADREGLFEWRPRQLKAAILPHWDGDFSRVLDALETRGFLVKYEADGRLYGWIPTFKRHQWINGKEPKSKMPPPPAQLPNLKGIYERVADVSSVSTEREPHAPLQIPSLPDPDPDPKYDPDPDAREPEPPTGVDAPRPLDPVTSPLAERARFWVRDSTRAQFEHGSPETWPEVVEAFEAFRAVWPHAGKLRGRDPRAVRIVERFAEGFSVAELAEAALGSKRDEHIATHPEFQNPMTVWRDAAQVDKYVALARIPASGPALRSGAETPAERRTRDQLRRVAELEAEEARAR